ncbi:MAG: class I SAM-dependent methyltransferase [Zhaonellaceae bacterium]|nr:methyltransferase domain-containing protein [Clostridia bacterium]
MSFTWVKQNIDWLEKAAPHTTYYADIVKLLKPWLRQSDSLLDIGCGTGNFAFAFAPHVKKVTAVDINPLVIDLLKQKCTDLGVKNVYPIEADWRDIPLGLTYDVVFMSYINGLASEHFLKLATLSTRLIIAVLPKFGREKSFGLENYLDRTEQKGSGRETFYKAIDFLKTRYIPFKAMEHSCDFGQPFDSMEEYYYFLNFYFGLEKQNIPPEYTSKHLQKTPQGYYLPNLKESGIIIIRKEDVNESQKF